MIKNGLIRRYKVDPYGTEEIVSNDILSIAPILDIDYGDGIQQGTQFVLRPTKGMLDPNVISPAVINVVKGDTVKWNQVFPDNVSITLNKVSARTRRELLGRLIKAGNKILVRFTLSNVTQSQVNNNLGLKTQTSTRLDTGSASLVNIENGKAAAFFNDTTDDVGTIYFYIVNTADSVTTCTVSNVDVFDLTEIFGSGKEPSTLEAFEAWLAQKLGLKECYPYNSSSLISVKMTGIKTVGINPAWESITNIPVTALKGRLNGTGSSVVIFPDGMKSAGDVRDEIKVENGALKGFKRVDTRAYESGDADSSTMTTDGVNYTNYALTTMEEYNLDAISAKKVMLGNEELTKVYCGDQLLFEQNS